MNYVEAINDFTKLPRPWVFMAGGITNCVDWQQDLNCKLADVYAGTLINPRRVDFPIGDPGAAAEQIAWEHKALWSADVFSMWFDVGSIQPICMFELGAHLARFKLNSPPLTKVVIGVHPDYERKQDVMIQTELIMDSMISPAIEVVDNLDAQASVIAQYVSELVD